MQISRRQLLGYGAASSAMLALGVGFARQAAAKGVWEPQSNMPIPMQEIYPAVFDGKIFVGGGFIKSDVPTFADVAPSSDVFVYDGTSWKRGPSLPQARHHLGMVSNGANLFAIGGFYGVPGKSWQIQSSVFRLSPNNDTWITEASLPSPQAESVYAAIGDNIHVVGGKRVDPATQRLGDSNKHFVLTKNGVWEEAAPALTPRNSAAGASIDGKIYVVGGRVRGGYDTNLKALEVYDPKADKWQSLRPMPLATAGHAATVLDGKLYVFGGEIFGEGGNWKTGSVFRDVWAYDPQTDNWVQFGEMPQSRHGLGVVTFRDKLHILGGGERSGPRGMMSSVYARGA